MKTLILLICTFCLVETHAQWCNTSVNAGTITPTTTVQTTPAVAAGSRYYWSFTGQAGCEYTFSTCGLASGQDTYLRLYDATGATLLAQNDDGCGTQSSLTVLFNVTGTYTIHLARFSCNTLSASAQLSYSVNCSFSDNECYGATQICNDNTFTANTASAGSYQELNASNQGCLAGGEHQSYWYYFQPVMNGTIQFNINTCATCDYDFAIWATGNCGNLGLPIRCSYDATEGVTGLNSSATDNSEGAGGPPFPNPTPKFVAPLNVVAGQTYLMLIDNYTANNEPYAIDFTFSNSGLLNCTPVVLPIDVVSFDAIPLEEKNLLKWKTSSEDHLDRMEVYSTTDPSESGSWSLVKTIKPSGALSGGMYGFEDDEFRRNSVNYYKLVLVDQNNTSITFPSIRYVDNTHQDAKVIQVMNLLGQEVAPDSKGTLLLIMEDGTIKKVVHP